MVLGIKKSYFYPIIVLLAIVIGGFFYSLNKKKKMMLKKYENYKKWLESEFLNFKNRAIPKEYFSVENGEKQILNIEKKEDVRMFCKAKKCYDEEALQKYLIEMYPNASSYGALLFAKSYFKNETLEVVYKKNAKWYMEREFGYEFANKYIVI